MPGGAERCRVSDAGRLPGRDRVQQALEFMLAVGLEPEPSTTRPRMLSLMDVRTGSDITRNSQTLLG